MQQQLRLGRERQRYILTGWTAEKRPSGWYIAKTAYYDDKPQFKGPYSSIASATLMIARELKKELLRRDGHASAA
jgi:hypothetical protein